MSFIDAIKAYAIEKGTVFRIPKKDTPEYDAIKEIQEKLKHDLDHPVDKTVKKVKPVKQGNTEPVVHSDPIVPTAPKKRQIVSNKKVENVEVEPVAVVKDEPKKAKKVKVSTKVANVEPVIVEEVVTKDVKVPKVKKATRVANVPVIEEVIVTKDVKVAKVKKINNKLDNDPRFIILNTPVRVVFD